MEASRWATTSTTDAHTKDKTMSSDTSQASHTTGTASRTTDVPDMGAFAQTRPPDDLFSDDFTPLAEPLVEVANPHSTSDPTEPSLGFSVQSQQQPKPHRKHQSSRNNPKQPTNTPNTALSPSDTTETTSPNTPKGGLPTQPVRGDRSATGGPAKSKLTEDELNAKMKAMKVKNSALEEAHARSQADEQSFQASEAAVKQRQKQDRVNRQAMLSEREKNAQRKMQAQQGRDWDTSKEEADIVERPHRRPMRGAYGGVTRDTTTVAQTASGYAEEEPQASVPFSSRGGDRGRGNRGRGKGAVRGGIGGNKQSGSDSHPQSVPSSGDFPALSDSISGTGAKPSESKIDTTVGNAKPSSNRKESYNVATTPAEKKSWADQMDETQSPAWESNAREQKAPKGGW